MFVELFHIPIESKVGILKTEASPYAVAVPFLRFYEGKKVYLLMEQQLVSLKGLRAISDILS